jgi:glucose-6-phosphate isomerase
MKIKLPEFSENEFFKAVRDARTQCEILLKKQGKGNDFLGWIDLPGNCVRELEEIKDVAKSFVDGLDVIVVVGIGGSNLGAKAIYDGLKSKFNRNRPEVLFAGNNLDEDYHYELVEYLKDKEFGIIVISKSGTTTEPAIAFRILREKLEHAVGKKEASKRIIAITDKEKGALRKLADKEGYKTFVIPDDVGGRYSVLSPVGLVPLAVAGINIEQLCKGALEMRNLLLEDTSSENIALQYAAARNLLYNQGFKVELLVNYNTSLVTFAEWWKQLFGESEGKDGKGLFPASANFTTDLHSLGQFIQEGSKILFETVITVNRTNHNLTISRDELDTDGLNYIAGKKIDFVNKKAMQGTYLAHTSADVPNIIIEIEKIDEYNFGKMIYFFEVSCAISGYMLGVNPFNQPGVEAYKKNMFALLGKPGYESEREKLKKQLGIFDK